MGGVARGSRNRAEKPTSIRERELLAQGYMRIAGCDEAGRGPLAGPVVAAAVILPADLEPHLVHGLRDSKQLSAQQRERFYNLIVTRAVCYNVGTASPEEIDRINILQASLLAMKRALENLTPPPDYVLVDGVKTPALERIPSEGIVGGDRRSVSIAAASVVAKVVRDRMMVSYHARYPQYGFDNHKGYPTPYHRAALEVFGASQIHRHSFAGVAERVLAPAPSPAFQRLYKRFAARLTQDRLENLKADIENSCKLLSKAEYFVLRYRCFHLLQEIKETAIDLRPTAQELGQAKEELAAQYLERHGYKIWERNFRIRRGEIDIIANQADQVIFVEVKMRTGESYGGPLEAVTKRKQRALIRTAETYLAQRGLQPGWNVRFDVISITECEGRSPRIEHLQDAFRPD